MKVDQICSSEEWAMSSSIEVKSSQYTSIDEYDPTFSSKESDYSAVGGRSNKTKKWNKTSIKDSSSDRGCLPLVVSVNLEHGMAQVGSKPWKER